ncbi:molecular chaperone [Providencia stuartii]|uniref:fimbrial biogenesis chaperone n=1 Tax=Providencia stuartii TaxID=588 RepID=UPI00300CB654
MHCSHSLRGMVVSLWLFSAGALAGISLDSTRVIFPASDARQGQSIGVTSSSTSTTPYLVKAQVIGNIEGTQTQTPFSVTPSLFRLEPSTTNQVRILKTGNDALPKDRESLFYFRVMALPAGKVSQGAVKQAVDGSLMISTGNIIKLFYRPAGLPKRPPLSATSLTFSHRGTVLRVTNPSPYFLTLSSLTVGGKRIPMSLRQKNTMIPPFGTIEYPNVNTSGAVTWQAINDYGGMEKFHGTVQ